MSLTRILTSNRHQLVRDVLKHCFPKPEFNLNSEILAPPCTQSYSTVGQAIDYLIRFYLEHKYKNKVIADDIWIADKAYNYIKKQITYCKSPKISIGFKDKMNVDKERLYKCVEEKYNESKVNYIKFFKNGKVTVPLIQSCIFLARLDVTYRTANISDELINVNNTEINDVINMFSCINPDHLKVKKYCYVNPTFGMGSKLTRGADADLIIDGTIIDIKSTLHLSLERSYYNQIIGYYILYLIGGINFEINKHKVSDIGIYYARYGQLWKTPVSDIADNNMLLAFTHWFYNYVNSVYHCDSFIEGYEKRLLLRMNENNKGINYKNKNK